MKKKILITGVAGMIGSHLLDQLLKRGYQVVGVDNLSFGKKGNIAHNLKNNNFKFYKIDILDMRHLLEVSKGVSIIVHLAALKKISEKESSLSTLRVNAEGTKNIFEVARKIKAKVVFASTSDVYGVSENLPFSEEGNLVIGAPTAKRWAYAVSKLFAEQLAYGYYKEYAVPIVILRYFGGFSYRSSSSWSGGHVPIFIDSILKNKRIVIHGDGKQTRSMAHIDDMVRGTIMAIENPAAVGEIFNIGNNEEMSIKKCAYLIHRLAKSKKKIKIKYIPFKVKFSSYKDIKRRVPDLKKAAKVLGYKPKRKFKDALKEAILWRASEKK